VSTEALGRLSFFKYHCGMLSFLKPTLRTISTFVVFVVVEVGTVFFGALAGIGFLKDIFWYQIIWGAIVFGKFGISTSGTDAKLAAISALALAILIDLLVIYIIAAFISKRFFEKNK